MLNPQGPLFEAITVSALLERLFAKFRSVLMGILHPRNTFVGSDTDVGGEALLCSLCCL